MFRRTALSLALLVVFATACATDRGAAMDRQIENNVRNQISSSMSGHTYTSDVVVRNGVVTLSGRTRSEEDRRTIGDAANKVKNVKSVINNLEVSQQ